MKVKHLGTQERTIIKQTFLTDNWASTGAMKIPDSHNTTGYFSSKLANYLYPRRQQHPLVTEMPFQDERTLFPTNSVQSV